MRTVTWLIFVCGAVGSMALGADQELGVFSIMVSGFTLLSHFGFVKIKDLNS